MKVGFGKLNERAVIPDVNTSLPGVKSNVLPLVTPVPIELQVGERLDLKTGLVVRVPEGYILSIQPSPALLVYKGLEVLGPTFVAPGDEDELKIPLLNVGKNQLNLHIGMQVAVAILHMTEPVEIEEFSPEKKKAGRPQRPGKKDPFTFKVT